MCLPMLRDRHSPVPKALSLAPISLLPHIRIQVPSALFLIPVLFQALYHNASQRTRQTGSRATVSTGCRRGGRDIASASTWGHFENGYHFFGPGNYPYGGW